MPERPRSHQLETTSRIRFHGAMADADWVSRPMDQPDYGIDEEVEIFVDNRTTGLTFKVQIKAIEESDAIGPSVDIKIDHFEYWNSLGVPVLLVLWVASEDVLYAKWVHRYDFGLKGAEGKTRRVRFGPEDRLAARIPALHHEVEVMRTVSAGGAPRPIPLSVTFEPEELANAFRYQFRRFIVRSEMETLLRVVSNDLDAIQVTITPLGMRTALPVDVASINLHFPGDYAAQGDWDRVICDILCCTAILCARQGATADAMRCLTIALADSRVPDSSELSMEIAALLYHEDRGELAFVKLLQYYYSDDIVPEELLNTYYTLTSRAADRLQKDELKALTKAAKHRIKYLVSDERPHDAARLAHNFANLLGSAKNWAKIEPMLDIAIDLDSEAYATRADEYVLRGNARWNLGDLPGSVEAYKRARELGELDDYIVPPLSDSLFAVGRYRESAELIDEWIERGAEPDSRSIFRRVILAELIEGLGVEGQDRYSMTDDEISIVVESGDRAAVLDALKRSDALDPRLWQLLTLDPEAQDGPSPLGRHLLAAFFTNDATAWALSAFIGILIEIDDKILQPILDEAVAAEGALEIIEDFETVPSFAPHKQALSALRDRILAYEARPKEEVGRFNLVDEKNAILASVKGPEDLAAVDDLI